MNLAAIWQGGEWENFHLKLMILLWQLTPLCRVWRSRVQFILPGGHEIGRLLELAAAPGSNLAAVKLDVEGKQRRDKTMDPVDIYLFELR